MNPARWTELAGSAPSPGDSRLITDELLDLVPELIPTRTTPQTPVHHAEGDVWVHTKMVVRSLVQSDAYGRASPADRVVLFLAALLHDIAKPSTTIIEPDGRIRQPGHSKRGAIDARALLWKAGAPFEARERICSVILHHQVPFFGLGDRGGRSGDALVRTLSWETRLSDLIAVARADIRGRIAPDIDRVLSEIDLFELQAMELDCLDRPFLFPDETTRFAYFRRKGGIAADYPFFEQKGPLVTFVCGMAGAGKDHWLKLNYTGPIVSYDDVRESMEAAHGEDEGTVAQATKEQAREFLRAGLDFAWNATALKQSFREQRIDLARDYGARIRIVHVETPDLATIRAQNRQRARSLPDSYYEHVVMRWELPLATEGHQVHYVRRDGEQRYLKG